MDSILNGAVSNGKADRGAFDERYGTLPRILFGTAGQADQWDLVFETVPADPGYRVRITHSDIISEATARRIAETFGRVLSGFGTLNDLSGITLVSDADIELQERINRTRSKLRYGNIIEAFLHHLDRAPGQVLVAYLDRVYTYAESDRISGGIANALVRNGISKGDRVAIMVPRSEWYVLCTLGVLKCGAAIVPIDTAYPDERVSYMLRDSG